MSSLRPDQSGDSRKVESTDLLGGASGPVSQAGREASLTQQVTNAVTTLDAMKQVVINHRFGLSGHTVLSYEAIAKRLTESLSVELRKSIALEQGVNADQVAISQQRVRELETEALRDLRCKKAT